MKIFVTGASGFVGGAAVKRFVAQGHCVRAMSRSPRSDDLITQLGALPVRCSLEQVGAEDIEESDVVVHSAAFVDDWGPRNAWHVCNVEGTQKMLQAAKEAGVERFVHVGTEAALVYGQHLEGADESYPLAPDSPYPYCATKAQAERLVRLANGPGFETLVVRPRFVWGPGDTTLLPALVRMAGSGQWRWLDGGRARTSTTHIDNLVHALELALRGGKPGEAYFVLDDGDITMRDMLSAMAASRQLSLPDASMSSSIADLVARGAEWIWRSFGLEGKPPITRHAVMMMSRSCTLRDAKARRELDYAPVISREQGLRELGMS